MLNCALKCSLVFVWKVLRRSTCHPFRPRTTQKISTPPNLLAALANVPTPAITSNDVRTFGAPHAVSTAKFPKIRSLQEDPQNNYEGPAVQEAVESMSDPKSVGRVFSVRTRCSFTIPVFPAILPKSIWPVRRPSGKSALDFARLHPTKQIAHQNGFIDVEARRSAFVEHRLPPCPSSRGYGVIPVSLVDVSLAMHFGSQLRTIGSRFQRGVAYQKF